MSAEIRPFHEPFDLFREILDEATATGSDRAHGVSLALDKNSVHFRASTP